MPNLTSLAVGALMLVMAFISGGVTDHFYGPNAWWKANREAEDRAKNAVLSDLAKREDAAGLEEERRFQEADAAFGKVKQTVAQCVLTAEQATALNLVRE